MALLKLLKRSDQGDRNGPARPLLRFFNTLSGEVEPFVPLSPKLVKMYNCGPTVYDRQHIGNLRPYIFADVLRRALEHWGYPVKQVINITDVGHLTSDADEGEDKMEKSAREKKRSTQEIAEEVTQWWFEDLDALSIDREKILFTRATDYIGEQIALVQTLEEKGYAYTISDGVYFDTKRFPEYGKLGHINLEGQQEGARVKENEEKRSPHDFALWKFSPKRKKREQEWDSPWGKGFPGWHIECTAMIFKELGRQIDIHTGGVDHIPVHHNNELAQAEAASGRQYVRYWLHNEFITIEGKKVSKSLRNTIYLHQMVDRGLSPLALRYWYLTGHYRSPMNFAWDALAGADQALTRLSRTYLEAPEGAAQQEFLQEFLALVGNDLDTPKALALVWERIKELNKTTLKEVDQLLGLGFSSERPVAKLAVIPQSELPAEVQELLQEREAARTAKDFEKADTLRAAIEERGYFVKDTAEGPKLTAK
jgi:cysteinyl-tRNA synthetase